jgi:D-glycero-alpha-D-manno-heptose 1-phosphate guanylyltransferase
MTATPPGVAIVLAGGRGTRLQSVVADVPKPLAPIAGRPFLDYLLARLAAAGIPRIVLSVGYRAEAIMAHVGERVGPARIDYVVEDAPLGTGGAIREALGACAGEDALALNGDTLLELDYAAFLAQHRARGALLSMAVRHVPDTSRYGAVAVDDARVVAFGEKSAVGPGLINSGAYLLSPALRDALPATGAFSFELDFLAARCRDLAMTAFVADGYMIDIGVPEDFARAQIEIPARIPLPA